MSQLEEQSFLAQREHSDFDQRPVPGARRSDLDSQLIELWSRTARELDPQGLGRFTEEDLLYRAGIVTLDGTPTRAGLLALGVHPQQFFPRYVINMSTQPANPDSDEVRAAETTTVTGPIPVMLDSAMTWARKVLARDVRADETGALHDHWEYPLEAIREVIGNALVHRDLDE